MTSPNIVVPETYPAITIGQRETHVVLFSNGEPVFRIPWKMAIEVSNELKGHARRAETFERLLDGAARDSLVADQKLLVGAGISLNLGITNGMYEGVLKDSNAPKKMGIVGLPTVKMLPPTPEEAADHERRRKAAALSEDRIND